MTSFKTSLPRTALLLALSACGGSVANPAAQGSSNPDAGSPPPPTSVNEDAGSPPSPSPPAAPAPTTCNTLSLTGPAQTVQAGTYGSIATDKDGVLVGIVDEDSTAPFAYHFWAREVAFDGTALAAGVNLFEDTNGVLAAAGGHAAAVGNNRGCSFTLLGPDATPEGTGGFDTNLFCTPFVATPSGFAMIESDSVTSTTLVTTDASGAVTSTAPILLSGAPFGMAVLPDGSFLVLESIQTTNCGMEGCPQVLDVVHVGVGGLVLGSPQQVGSIPPESFGPTAIVAVGNGAVVAVPSMSPTTAGAAVAIQAVDGNGNLVGQAANLGAGNLMWLGAAAVQPDVAVVAWVEEPPDSGYDQVMAQAVSSAGAVLSPPVVATSLLGEYAYGVGVAATPAGALLAWGSSTNVVAAPLSCAP